MYMILYLFFFFFFDELSLSLWVKRRPGYLEYATNLDLVLFPRDSMGGFRSFFIESKSFQLVIEEGGNFFSFKIFEWGKYYM